MEYYINEDGSGKVHIVSEDNLTLDKRLHTNSRIDKYLKETDAGKQHLLHKHIKTIVDSTKGVTHWNDVHFTYLSDGVLQEKEEFIRGPKPMGQAPMARYMFEATAYFDDITKVHLHTFPDIEVESFSPKNIQFSHISSDLENEREMGQLNKPQDPKELQQAMKMQLGFLLAGLEMMAQTDLEIRHIYHLPNKIKSSKLLEENEADPYTASFTIDSKFLREINMKMSDFDYNASDFDSLVTPMDVLKKELFGEEMNLSATMGTGLFSGKTKQYVSKEDLESTDTLQLDIPDLPEVRHVDDFDVLSKSDISLSGARRFHASSPFSGFTYVLRKHSQNLNLKNTQPGYLKKKEAIDSLSAYLFNGVIYTGKSKFRPEVVFEVKNGELDGSLWRWGSYKANYEDGEPNFESEVFYPDNKKGSINFNPLTVGSIMQPRHRTYLNGGNSMIAEDDEFLWFFGGRKGRDVRTGRISLVQWSKEKETVKVFNKFNTPIAAGNLRNMAVDQNGRKWIGTNNGLFSLHNGHWEKHSDVSIKIQKKPLSIHGIAINPLDQSVWMKSEQNELIQLDTTGQWHRYGNCRLNITDMVFHEEKLWMGLYYEGIASYDYKKGMCDQDVMEQSRIWSISSEKGRVSSAQIHRIDKDEKGNIWALGDVLFRYNIKTDKLEGFTEAITIGSKNVP